VATLCRAPWPGNVRELQNVIAALVVGGPSAGRITARQVDDVLGDRASHEWSPPTSLARARLQCDRRTVAASLARHANQRAAAARELGVSRQGLVKLIARLNLDNNSQ
jgi:transcriptional regulator with PAS, ATPase and Fis domain